MNMPAGSDVNRLLTHIARLEREVRELRKQFTDVDNATYLAAMATHRELSASAQHGDVEPGCSRPDDDVCQRPDAELGVERSATAPTTFSSSAALVTLSSQVSA
jgi:hypothetical protein